MNIGFNDLDRSSIGVLKGLVSGGSTSEGIAGGFITGDLDSFDGPYRNFNNAWKRLDIIQRLAVLDFRNACGIDHHFEYSSDSVLMETEGFVEEFIKWKKKKILNIKEMQWRDENWDYEDDYLPSDIEIKLNLEVEDALREYCS